MQVDPSLCRLLALPGILERLLPVAHGVDFVALEQQFSKQNNADRVLAYVRVAFELHALKLGLLCKSFNTSTIRLRVVGKGNASKEEVRQVLEKRYGTIFNAGDVMRRGKVCLNYDQSDAVAVAVAAADFME
jgi:Holliday junction resolvasome RuvABC endonuclease subunit